MGNTFSDSFFLSFLDNTDFDKALHARSVLFEASKENITDHEKLDEFMKKKGIKAKIFDTKPTFVILAGYLKEDKVNATPTCIITKIDGKQERYKGNDIVKALENLR